MPRCAVWFADDQIRAIQPRPSTSSLPECLRPRPRGGGVRLRLGRESGAFAQHAGRVVETRALVATERPGESDGLAREGAVQHAAE